MDVKQRHNNKSSLNPTNKVLFEGNFTGLFNDVLFIDRVSRVLFPVGFITFNIAYWAYYLDARTHGSDNWTLHAPLPSFRHQAHTFKVARTEFRTKNTYKRMSALIFTFTYTYTNILAHSFKSLNYYHYNLFIESLYSVFIICRDKNTLANLCIVVVILFIYPQWTTISTQIWQSTFACYFEMVTGDHMINTCMNVH